MDITPPQSIVASAPPETVSALHAIPPGLPISPLTAGIPLGSPGIPSMSAAPLPATRSQFVSFAIEPSSAMTATEEVPGSVAFTDRATMFSTMISFDPTCNVSGI
jgi:hypothetical protein